MKIKILVIVAILSVVFMVFTTVVAFALSDSKCDEGWVEETYYVGAGETLWSIGKDVCVESVDVRMWINEVIDLNGMNNSTLYVGQEIIILVPVE